MKRLDLQPGVNINKKCMENLNLDKFNPKKSEIISLVEEFKDLTIKDISDRVGYNNVRRARTQLQRIRIEITKQGKALRGEALQFQRDVIKLEKELVGLLLPTEEKLKTSQKIIDLEFDAIQRQELLPERNRRLKEINVEMDDSYLLLMNDKQFNEYFNDEKSKYLEEKERKLQEEKDKLEKEKHDEEIRQQTAEKVRKEEQDKLTLAKRKAKLDKQKLIDDHNKKEQDRIAKEKEDIRLEEERKEKLEKRKKYIAWLEKNGYTEEKKNEFYITNKDNTFTIYKKLDEITIK